jgi:hypothetical protein
MKWLVVVGFLLTVPANASSLLVQTENGTVSVVPNLTSRECKKLLCQFQIRMTCFPQNCDDDGNIVELPNATNTCGSFVRGSDPKLVKCLD